MKQKLDIGFIVEMADEHSKFVKSFNEATLNLIELIKTHVNEIDNLIDKYEYDENDPSGLIKLYELDTSLLKAFTDSQKSVQNAVTDTTARIYQELANSLGTTTEFLDKISPEIAEEAKKIIVAKKQQ